jgi:hypothetical protein
MSFVNTTNPQIMSRSNSDLLAKKTTLYNKLNPLSTNPGNVDFGNKVSAFVDVLTAYEISQLNSLTPALSLDPSKPKLSSSELIYANFQLYTVLKNVIQGISPEETITTIKNIVDYIKLKRPYDEIAAAMTETQRLEIKDAISKLQNISIASKGNELFPIDKAGAIYNAITEAEQRKAEQERIEAIRLEAERKAEQERIEAIRLEAERKAEQERIEAIRLEAERKAEQAKKEAIRLEAERKAKQVRIEARRVEAERMAAEEKRSMEQQQRIKIQKMKAKQESDRLEKYNKFTTQLQFDGINIAPTEQKNLTIINQKDKIPEDLKSVNMSTRRPNTKKLQVYNSEYLSNLSDIYGLATGRGDVTDENALQEFIVKLEFLAKAKLTPDEIQATGCDIGKVCFALIEKCPDDLVKQYEDFVLKNEKYIALAKAAEEHSKIDNIKDVALSSLKKNHQDLEGATEQAISAAEQDMDRISKNIKFFEDSIESQEEKIEKMNTLVKILSYISAICGDSSSKYAKLSQLQHLKDLQTEEMMDKIRNTSAISEVAFSKNVKHIAEIDKMHNMNNEEQTQLKDIAKGIAIEAGVRSVIQLSTQDGFKSDARSSQVKHKTRDIRSIRHQSQRTQGEGKSHSR